ADQFIATVGAWQDLDLDAAGDFILMAATLLEIKSRMVTPPREGDEADEESDEELFDPRSELIQQLLAFRRFKDVPYELARLEAEQLERCPRQVHESIPEDPEEVESWSLDNADPYLLFRAWDQVMGRIAGLGPRRVVYDDVPMEERMGALISTMETTREARLSWLMERLPTPVAKVGMLVALLECTRQRFIETIQHEQYGEVFLRFRDAAERSVEPVQPPEPVAEPKRRRRRLALVTWHAAQPRADQGDGEAETDVELDEEPEEVVETDEQRFIRELNESCRVDAVLERGADLELGFAAFAAEKKLADEAAAIAKAEADERARVEAEAASAAKAEADERRRVEREAAKAERQAQRERQKAEAAQTKAGEPPAPSDGGPVLADPDGGSQAGQPL
ncbi:MAG TPA: segregation/condensation protein A, partial [Planctomycetota bacterium]|nr:segregation/condensation protein A [Planctomycetota bacterium]